ncbi:MAG: hypothetical protein JOZ39_06115 [Chloroflexi bacterium]|nr:hypothetical protein [Chloroflexota bacterium]
MIVYILTAINAIILGVVAYLFYAFRQAIDSSGVKQIDDYLHELEGSVAQLTEQFERTSTKISKDLLRKTTELQALIGECDTKLAQASRIRMPVAPEPASAPRRTEPETPSREPRIEPARFEAELAEELPVTAASDTPVSELAAPERIQPAPDKPAEEPAVEAPPSTSENPAPVAAEPAAINATIPAAVAARRMSASELLAGRPSRPAAAPAAPAVGQQPGAVRPVPRVIGAPARPSAQPAPDQGAAAGTPAQPVPATPAAITPAAAEPAAGESLPAGQSNDKYRLIFLLASEGMDTASIAKHTNLTRGEVEMLLDLRRQGKI